MDSMQVILYGKKNNDLDKVFITQSLILRIVTRYPRNHILVICVVRQNMYVSQSKNAFPVT